MSASLVGSEMCIRDRLHALATGGPLQAWSREPSSTTRGRRRCAVARLRPCLLYTSDAADDM
eukprot:7824136-Alexandrium_andersonii.AAC.1